MKKTIYAPIFVLALLLLSGGNAWAQKSNDIPKEGDIFYMEDMGNGQKTTMKKSPRKAETSPWTFTSVIETCFDKSKKGKEAWLMTADGETELNITLKYSGNDPNYTIDSHEVEFYWYNGNDIFHDDNKILITETTALVGFVGKDKTDKSATVYIRAPEVFPDPNLPYYTFYIVVNVKFKNGGSASVAKNLGVSRTGLFLLHGLNSERACFFPFRQYLMSQKTSYIVEQIYLGDYSTTNTSSFHDNTHVNNVVKKGLTELSNHLFDIGIASTKYCMVGHSMGGILERLYVQEVDNEHTYRLITLNTPHFGSLLGNTYKAYELVRLIPSVRDNEQVQKFDKALDEAFANDKSMQAVRDLAEGSDAIMNLASSAGRLSGIPVAAVGTEVENYQGVKNSVKEPFYIAYDRLMSHIFRREIKHERNYLDKDPTKGSDYVVSVESQKGGCEKNYIYRGHFLQAFHCKCTEWSVVHEQLHDLLTTSYMYAPFSTDGFGAPPASVRSKAASLEDEYVTSFAEPKSTSFIKIQAEETDEEGSTHKIKLTHSDDMMTTMAFCLLSKDDLIADYDQDEMYFDMSGVEGEKWIYAIGRTNYNALVMDSVKVVLGDPSAIKSVNQTPESDIKYAVQGNELIVKNVSGPYTVVVYNYAGQVLAEMKSNPSNTYVLPRNNNLMIIGVRTENGQKFIKFKK